MAILKAKKSRELSEKEMLEKMKELKLELSKERASSEIGGSVKNPGRMREIRRAIARIESEKGRRSIDAEKLKNGIKRSTKGASDSKVVS